MSRMKKGDKYSSFPLGIYVLLLVMIIVFAISTQGSVSMTHLLNIARSAAPLGIVAIGQTIVLLVGGLDLSLGTCMSMTNLILASMMNGSSSRAPQAILISMLICALVGFCNGLIITKFKMQPFLVTMAMSLVVQGGYYIYTQGIARGSIAEEIRFISEEWIGIVPVAVIIWCAFWLALSLVLHKTVYGKKLYLTGSSQQAAKLSGFQADGIVVSAYMIASMLACVAGIMLSAYIGVGSVDIGNSYTLDSIASSVIGGVAFTGGIGSLEGTFPGVLIITILSSLMTILGISEAGKFICQGTIIAVMVAINQVKMKNN